jgi:hypothetical protein
VIVDLPEPDSPVIQRVNPLCPDICLSLLAVWIAVRPRTAYISL